MDKISIKIPDDVKMIHNIFCHANYECNLVGGCVRDSLLNKDPHDYDLSTNADPHTILRLLHRAGIRTTDVGIEFGTIVAHINDESYEITTYRQESDYSDGRHPDNVSFVKNINTDLSRRDFTINAMAYDLDRNCLIDPYHGEDDLKNGILRMVRNPVDRINEDPLRILRGLRFAIRYGLQFETNTKQVFLENKDLISFVSKERITNEFKKIFSYNKPISPIFVEFAPIVFEIIPELAPCYKFDQKNKYHVHDVYEHILSVVDYCNTDSFEIKMAALLHDVGKPDKFTVDENDNGHFYGHPDVSYEIAQNVLRKDFCVTNEERSKILSLIKEHDHDLPITTKSIRKFVSEFGEDFINDWMILKKADIMDHMSPDPSNTLIDKYYLMEKTYREFLANESRFQLKDLSINGSDMLSIGLKGSSIGKTLNQLLEDVINESILNDHELLLQRAKEYNDLQNDEQIEY